jgi:hypothetical protein
MPDLEKLVQRLIEQRVEFVIIGGYAAIAHGVPLTTFDIDVCSPFTFENLGKIHSALAGLHPYHRETPQEIPFVMPDDFRRKLRNLYLHTDLGQIDFLGEILGVGDYASVHAHSQIAELPIGSCRILDAPTLLRAKEATGRPKDLLAAQLLRAILEKSG